MKSPTSFISLSLDTLAETCTIVGFAETAKEAKRQRKRVDDLYFKSFPIDDRMGRNMVEWFRASGVIETHARCLAQDVGKKILGLAQDVGKKILEMIA